MVEFNPMRWIGRGDSGRQDPNTYGPQPDGSFPAPPEPDAGPAPVGPPEPTEQEKAQAEIEARLDERIAQIMSQDSSISEGDARQAAALEISTEKSQGKMRQRFASLSKGFKTALNPVGWLSRGFGKGFKQGMDSADDSNEIPPAFVTDPEPDNPPILEPIMTEEESEADREQRWLEQTTKRVGEAVARLKELDPAISDEDARKAAALEIATENADNEMKWQLEQLRANRWDRFCQDHPKLKGLIRFAGGMVGGTVISVTAKIALLSVVATSAVPAAIFGGAVAGGIVAYKLAKARAHEREFGTAALTKDLGIEGLNLSAKLGETGYVSNEDLHKKIELALILVDDRRVLGQKEKVEELMAEIAKLQIEYDKRRIEKTLEIDTEALHSDEQIARALNSLEENQLLFSGVSADIDNKAIYKNYQELKGKKEAAEGRTAWTAAAVGAVLGGALSGLISHFIAGHGFGGGHLGHAAAENYAAGNAEFNGVVTSLADGHTQEAAKIAAKHGIDLLSYKVQGMPLGEFVTHQIQAAHTAGMSQSEITRMAYNMIAYPDTASAISTNSHLPAIFAHGDFLTSGFAERMGLSGLANPAFHHTEFVLHAARLAYLGINSNMAGANSAAFLAMLSPDMAAAIGGMLGAKVEKMPNMPKILATKEEREEKKKQKEEREKSSRVIKLAQKYFGFQDVIKKLSDPNAKKLSQEIKDEIERIRSGELDEHQLKLAEALAEMMNKYSDKKIEELVGRMQASFTDVYKKLKLSDCDISHQGKSWIYLGLASLYDRFKNPIPGERIVPDPILTYPEQQYLIDRIIGQEILDKYHQTEADKIYQLYSGEVEEAKLTALLRNNTEDLSWEDYTTIGHLIRTVSAKKEKPKGGGGSGSGGSGI